ncbi:serpin family protein [Candidatus Sumerlaeota bacterium]|nr:serpin family protein [Candidatus Sumerlaeota bacterium]
MKYLHFIKISRALLYAFMLLLVLGTDFSRETGSETPDISKRINEFTIDLLRHYAKGDDPPANAILSPQSVFHGLAMSYIASGGDTRRELRKVFHFPDENEQLLKDIKILRRQLSNSDKHERIDLIMADSLWLDETYADFREEYERDAQDAFEASLHYVKFKHRERASNDINKWVSEKTRGKIREIVDPDAFKSRSRFIFIIEPALVTVDTVYFNADWGSQFDKESTRKRDFHIDNSRISETMMMHQCSLLPYSNDEHLKFLEIPYVDNQYSMYIILPIECMTIAELINGMTMDKITGLKNRAFLHEVDVLLPRFEMKSYSRARDALSAMGVKSAFDCYNADFDRMIIKKIDAFRIFISEIFHSAYIDVHEEGTEAAAATGTVHFSFGCQAVSRSIPAQFHADHPFLFMIVHNESHSILFTGWMSNPEQME